MIDFLEAYWPVLIAIIWVIWWGWLGKRWGFHES